MHFSSRFGFVSRCLATLVDPGQVGRVQLLHRRRVGGRGLLGQLLLRGGFGVRRVVAVLAPDERVLADRGDGHELLARVAADLPRLRLHRAEREPAAREDLLVRARTSRRRTPGSPVEVAVEGVRVLHQELACPQQPEARPQLVAVLPVDLVEVHRQVAVRRVLARDERRDDLLGRGREAEPGLLAVLEPEHHRPVRGVAAAALPELERLDDRQDRLLGARPRPSPRGRSARPRAGPGCPSGQPRVDARGDLADVPAPDQQPVAVELGVGRVVPQGAQEELRHPHDSTGGHAREATDAVASAL